MRNDNVYAGILIQENMLRVVFVKIGSPNTNLTLSSPLRLVSFKGGKYDRGGKLTKTNREELLGEVAKHIASMPEKVAKVGVASYGPLLSVSISDGKDQRYGMVSKNSRHENLRGLKIYGTLRKALNAHGCSNIDVEIETDVTCGALHQAYYRLSFPKGEERYRKLTQQDIVVFLYFNQGVGGSFLVNMRPWSGAVNAEFGYIPTQVNADDIWGKKRALRAEKHHLPVYMEEMLAREKVLERFDVQSIQEVPEKGWDLIISNYIAQLCGAVTAMLAPHQIILHGPIISEPVDENGKNIDMAKLVRDKFRSWLEIDKKLYINYKQMEDLDSFIDVPAGIREMSNQGKEIIFEPMLLGAALLAVQRDMINGNKA